MDCSYKAKGFDTNNISRSFITQDIGKTVFITYEAAEAALKEREQNGKSN